MEARHSIYSNIVDSIISLIDAVEELKITFTCIEEKEKVEESKSVILKYSEDLRKNAENDTRRNCYSMDELSEKEARLHHRQMSTEVFGSSNIKVVGEQACPPSRVVQALKYLWSSPSIQQAYERRNEFQLIDSASYFLDDLDRVCTSDFEPTDDDILRTRVRTTGIVKIEFEFRHLMVIERTIFISLLSSYFILILLRGKYYF